MNYLIAITLITLPVVSYSAEHEEYVASIYVNVGANGGSRTFQATLDAKMGEPIDVRSGTEEEEANFEMSIVPVKVMSNEPPSYKANCVFRNYGKVIARPSLIVVTGQRGRFFTGDRDSGYIEIRLHVQAK